MALKFREEVVGKRFLALRESSQSQVEFFHESNSKSSHDSHINISKWIKSQSWQTGIIRASSEKDLTCKDSQILVEFDDTEWQKRDWLKVHTDCSVFLVEETLVVSQRNHPDKANRKCWWPALTFKTVVDTLGISNSDKQPVEFLIDQKLSFTSSENIAEYWEGGRGLDAECKEAAIRWSEYQDGQRILVSTPTVLVGFRVQVYRTEGTTQWFTAVIQHYNHTTKELSLLDDTVLEEHNESAELTQIIPLDGVVETILKGTEARIAPRRRACNSANKEQTSGKESATQSTQASSTSNQAISRTSKPINSVTTPNTSLRGGSAGGVTTVVTNKSLRKGGIIVGSRRGSTDKQSAVSSKKELKSLHNAAATAPTSVIRRVPKAEKRYKKVSKSGNSLNIVKTDPREDRRASRRRANKKHTATSESSSLVEDSVVTSKLPTPDNNVSDTSQSPSASSERDSLPDMHIKKQRILGAITESNNGQTSNSSLERCRGVDHSVAVSTIDSGGVNVSSGSGNNSNLLPPLQSSTAQSKQQLHSQRIDKFSESSVDGCSSGYSSAATNDSTISPRDKNGHRIPPSGLLGMNSTPRPSNSANTSESTLGSTSATKQLDVPSPLISKPKSNQEYTSNTSSPLVVDATKESPIVPYRDPDLLKRDAEVRKMAHTPSGSQPPNIPTSRSMPSAAASAGMPALAQQQAASLPAAAAMLNPQMAAAQHIQMQQLMQQYQLMEQYRQIQAMQTMNPYSLIQQQQQLAAQAVAAQQHLTLGSMFDRPPRPSLPSSTAAAAQWMMMPQFTDKPLISDLQREHELRALDQKDRADRAERQKIAKEKAEKERQDKEKEKQLIDRQERARILKESAQLAQDAVDQHFNETFLRMPHTTTTPPVNPSPNAAAMAMWGGKKAFMGAGDSVQPQDLSINNKSKDHHRPDLSQRQDRDRERDQIQAAIMAQQTLSEEKQKSLSRHHESFMRSIQTGSSGQQTSSQSKLVDEHFIKTGLSQITPKSEQAEYSLYGFQSQSFPYKFVTKDQLQQHLCKDEKVEVKDIKPTVQPPVVGKDMTKQTSQATPPRTATSQSAIGSHVNYSNQLIQEGLIPNPAYTPRVNASSNAPPNDASNSISALMSMSMRAGSHIGGDRYNKDNNSQNPVKSQSGSLPRNSQAVTVASTTSSSNLSQPPQQPLKSFKSFVESAVTQAFYKGIEHEKQEEEQQKKKQSSPRSPPVTANASIKSEKSNNGTLDTDSDTLSAPSPTLSVKTESLESKPCHPKMKLKKEWLQRHAEGGATGPSSSSPTSQSTSATLLNNSNMSNLSETTTSASETEAENQGIHKHRTKKRKSDSANSTNGQANKKTKNSEVSSGLQNKNMSRSSGSFHSHSGSGVKPAAGGDDHTQCSYNDEQDSIKQLAEIALQADRMEAIPYANKPLVRVNIATLKKTLQPFVQDGSCIEMAPKLSKCRECKMTPNQRNKKMPNIFCRFYAFRMLKFSKHGQISIAGFCDPSEAEPDDITIWLPHIATKTRNIEIEDVKTAKYIIANVGEEFCRLVEQEQECVNWSGNKRAWKRAVQGVREMCDVCDTTLFNTHWVCHRCGFVVCIDCYRVKRKIQTRTSNNVCEENRRWLSCTTNKNHEAEKLMLTSIIPADALKIARDLIHHVRRKHSIKSNCMCIERSEDGAMDINGVSQHLLEAAVASKTSLTNGQSSSDSESKLSLSYPQDVYRQSTYLSASLDNKTLNTYSDDPLSLLADVASMAPSTTNGANLLSEAKPNGTANVEEMDIEPGDKKPCITLRKLLTKSQANGNISLDKKVHETVHTAMEPAISNSLQSPSSLHSPSASKLAQSSTASSSNHEFAHYQRRSGAYLSGRAEAIPTCYLKETSMLYPDVKHSWLCEGKLLVLHDPQHPNNYALFNQRWTLGQPIVVSNVSKHMKVEELWTPEAFSKEFGLVRHDLIDCRRNEPLNGYQIKCFWDGFEDQSKRLTDADGQPLILKLKDWPTAEDFAESMPSRFQDLMSALPMPQYTQRNGELNLAGRLPEFFVKPDLGPKMYIAYGLAKYPQSGTTNLHLDVSDAVNVMVFVAHEKELEPDVMKLIEDSDCDDLMKQRIVEGGETPGALWHIYDACDADKMRDLLNKVALELGMELEPYHDPIHDQQFYLDKNLRRRLAEEYGVHGYPILQCVGDAVFIPAGAPHQVQNLNGCIKVAEDFVSPEHLHHCFNLTQEFRHLSNTHANHEDKLQVKNIIYHAIKDAVAVLDQSEPVS